LTVIGKATPPALVNNGDILLMTGTGLFTITLAVPVNVL
jgi:hypothetical protein